MASITVDGGNRSPKRETLGPTPLRIAPVMVLLAVFAVLPFALMLWYSLTDFSFTLPNRRGFIGLENYQRILHDVRLRSSLGLTSLFVLLAVMIEATLGLGLALLLASNRRPNAIALAALCVPLVLPSVAVGLIWRLLLHGDYGLIGYPLASSGWLGADASVLGSPTTAFLALVVSETWQWTPFFALVFFAGIQAQPKSPVEAARVDGATSLQVLRHVTLPLLRPTLFAAVVLRSLDAVKEFDKVFVLTRGGPASSTELFSLYVWIVSFDHGNLAYGSALTTLAYTALLILFGRAFKRFRPEWR
jgi:multiple sugar transport system permease protein